ncbi:hypothetical protein IM660_15980 [Ruania alkalisoli]|uniref:PQQ-binding-like beta-propeller repeat protein n=1 Tax=Ruania alkalisoli TaxID=2779775 RepID=A0A7M1SRC1_9MICO|nr:hypothetical protein [Ruania alkalisoli]QOR70110.1 hypothetical protein IM660_15980 [Ruania alkalisoli]
MGRRDAEEFALSSSNVADTAEAAGGPRGRGRVRVASSPWLWVLLAVVLLVAGAITSPRLLSPEPEAAWQVELDPGSAPRVWVLPRVVLATTATGLVAFDADGQRLWGLDLDDPTCTTAQEELICVHGEAGEATVSVVAADGAWSDLSMPGADVAARTPTGDLVVAGSNAATSWLGRYSPDGEEQWVQEQAGGVSWADLTVQQDVVTAMAGPSPDLSGLIWTAYVADGAPASMSFAQIGSVTTTAVDDPRFESDTHRPLWLASRDLTEHPDAAITVDLQNSTGIARFEDPGGAVISWASEVPLAALGTTVYTSSNDLHDAALSAVEAPDGRHRWSVTLPGSVQPVCPCAATEGTFTVAGVDGGVARPGSGEVELLFLDQREGRVRARLPIGSGPWSLASDGHATYLFADGVLSAFLDPRA